ncbi:PREDICTED: nucleolar protein of 40 kDa-like [Dufourea novaeangliae]|uniref:Nucleolar protein of 40 kDa n=1 Tax=Dufourea novaeangliae TaxID=178035 RepID=A0A154P423_DUFNO|nr:PREDICTED: nucleolar protein of 40 kDa-like [Dufourea novaeangliae]KZC06695.1 Nucleolar protein of 40 kDa [Dufourea novaeangliae]
MVNCKLNQIFLGEVASIQNYGAFVRIPGCASQGLIHKSQVSSAHVENVAEVLQRGERVWCKVISVGDDGKVGLSMKYVNQGNGTDLDPNGVDLQRDIQKKKTIGKYERKAIHLEAVLNTTCTKCGTVGHLSNDCFMSPDGKKYELIPENEEVVPLQSEENEKEKKHKQKKLKKKRKAKKHKQNTDDSGSDEKEVIKKKKKKHSKDQKKKKKRKYDSSFSDESSDDSSSSHDVKAHKQKQFESSEKRAKKCKHSKSKYPDR